MAEIQASKQQHEVTLLLSSLLRWCSAHRKRIRLQHFLMKKLVISKIRFPIHRYDSKGTEVYPGKAEQDKALTWEAW